MTTRTNFILALVLLTALSSPAFAADDSAPAISFGDDASASPYSAGFMKPPTQPEGWSALPKGRPFPSLATDPRDLKLALRKNSKGELEADVGGYKSFSGWRGTVAGEDTVLHMGLEGTAYFVMRKEGSKFPLQSSDGLIGLYAEAARGLWMYQLRYTHISAHLSDGLYNQRNRIVYTRETVSLRAARQLGFTRVYAGYHFLAHTVPVLPRHSLQLGFYSIFPWEWNNLHPYFGSDLKLRGAEEGTNLTISGGVALVSRLGAAPLRLAVAYSTGHDLRGQFYFEEQKKWSVGLEMDF